MGFIVDPLTPAKLDEEIAAGISPIVAEINKLLIEAEVKEDGRYLYESDVLKHTDQTANSRKINQAMLRFQAAGWTVTKSTDQVGLNEYALVYIFKAS